MLLLTKPGRDVDSAEVEEIRTWLIGFAAAVRGADYFRGRSMFDMNVVSFGSASEILDGLDDLEFRQWRNIWGVTRGFDFDHDSLHCEVSGDTAWAAALWSSQGINHKGWYDRRGRCTFIFQRADDRWLAVHSHFSLAPRTS